MAFRHRAVQFVQLIAGIAVEVILLRRAKQRLQAVARIIVDMAFFFRKGAGQLADLPQDTVFPVGMAALQFIAGRVMDMCRLCQNGADEGLFDDGIRQPDIAAVFVQMLVHSTEGFLFLGDGGKHKGVSNTKYDHAAQHADDLFPRFLFM